MRTWLPPVEDSCRLQLDSCRHSVGLLSLGPPPSQALEAAAGEAGEVQALSARCGAQTEDPNPLSGGQVGEDAASHPCPKWFPPSKHHHYNFLIVV